MKNIPEIRVVPPNSCVGQEKNARYFMPEIFKQLVENIKRDGHLESVPLVYEEDNKLRIISGHHRIEASKQAGLKEIPVMVIKPKSKDEIISKQLSHNALVGKDDEMILKELFDSIKEMQEKVASGISSDIDKIDYVSLNFKLGNFRELVLQFAPSAMNKFTETLDEIEKLTMAKPNTVVRIADYSIFDKFADGIRKVKKIKNIKSNAVAIEVMTEIVHDWILKNNGDEKQI